MNVRARHVTSEQEYRSPFGAVQLGGTVLLAIDVWADSVKSCTLRIWTDAHGEELITMDREQVGDHLHFSAQYTPAETGVVWYSFDIEAGDGAVWRYGARDGWTTGEGAFAYGEPPSFQITVYVPREHQPMWYREGIVYQIFPDRFARGEDWEERTQAALSEPRGGVPRAIIEDWETPPTYKRNADTSVARWDFYGGNFEGIREHLDYLANLGVTVIYLNPIFEAASNHRYDTADYLRIDPMLGDEQSLRDLCADAEAHGISIILDGVFNHCGRDSRYFNRDNTYAEPGAWQGEQSPYRDWFTFYDDGTYACWWGNPDLPNFNEDAPGYHELICGEDGVVRKWMRCGVRGWRLDVADELPDEFIADIKTAAVTEREDALLLGEVWEDASHKLAYGRIRQYFEGEELDGTMNYPLRTAVLAYMRNEISANELADRIEELRENYPPDNFYSSLNLMGSHDRERLFTMLGNAPYADSLSERDRESYRLPQNQASLATSRLWIVALLQMTLPGVPCIYYGDERGLEGFRDPYNRATFPWEGDRVRMDCTTIYRNAIALRKTLPLFVSGSFEPFAANKDVFGFWRRDVEGRNDNVCVLVNASLSTSHTVRVPMVAESVSDVISGGDPAISHGQAEVFLWPLGSTVLHFHNEQRLQKPLKPGMGVLCHITSIPNGGRPGTLGAPAHRFIDWLAESGQRYWQVLPVNPADEFGSPYAGLAAFAGNTSLLEHSMDETLLMLRGLDGDEDYRRFCEENDYWLTPYATFRAIKAHLNEAQWTFWPERYHTYSPDLADTPELRGLVEANKRLQYEFSREWNDLLDYAHERGVLIIGDMPMYVSGDSADVWSNPEIFDLDERGRPQHLAGAPGDAFTPEGQLWGNPTYRWNVLAETNYEWWMRRFERAFQLYDYVRLDHFIGFSSYYKIDKGKLPKDGSYAFGPGLALFEEAYKRFGQLPFIAEDLGLITPAVRALVSATGFPSMDVVQFSDDDVRYSYEPKKGAVAYTGTHDNQTLVGWCESHFGLEEDKAGELADGIIKRVLASDASVAILPLQDVLGLDDTARMNVPGKAEGNWSWHADDQAVEEASERLRKLAEKSGRSTQSKS